MGAPLLGPLLFGLTHRFTGSHRDATVSPVVFFVLGFVPLLRVPVERAVAAVDASTPHRI